MPVYEYEHLFDECELCEFRFGVVQGLNEEALQYCPSCGLEVRRVVSQVSVMTTRGFNAGKAADKGFTTWKRSGEGEWEKVAGPGVDAIVASEADRQAVQEEQRSKKAVDLD
ncbi:MAG: hypothetical protein JSS66_03675 [Armatimonadetes bacterium]|nr:hypothetical protein [Armatimonadota bacterium]